MRRLGFSIIVAIIFGLVFNGCALFMDEYAQQKENSCIGFERVDKAFIRTNGYLWDNFNKRSFSSLDDKDLTATYKAATQKDYYFGSVYIIDYKKGQLRSGDLWKIYCPKIKLLEKVSSETKSFAVNGGGKDDFNVKITKEVHNAQQVKNGEIIKQDIQIPIYKIEKIFAVKHNGFIYKADSPQVKKLENDYKKLEQTFRDDLPCFKLNRKRYCDGDIVGGNMMLRVFEKGYGQVGWRLYHMIGTSPVTEAGYVGRERFEMKPPEVIGNKDLMEHKVSLPDTLKLKDVKTFEELISKGEW
ncbi:hypothetical protein [Helicobacter sp. 23-1045]